MAAQGRFRFLRILKFSSRTVETSQTLDGAKKEPPRPGFPRSGEPNRWNCGCLTIQDSLCLILRPRGKDEDSEGLQCEMSETRWPAGQHSFSRWPVPGAATIAI